MKKLLVLTLVVVMALGLFAACGGESATPTTTEAPTETATGAPVATTEAPTEAEASAIVIDKVSKHENGWAQGDQFGNEQFHGVYFNAKTNDAPFSEAWDLEYTPNDLESVILVRDGEEYDITLMGAGMVVKFSKTGYALKFEEWMIDELFPVTDGDMIILSGDFVDVPTGECTIHFEPIYITFAGGNAKFATEDPRVEG